MPSLKPHLSRKTSVTSPGASRALLIRRASIQSVEMDCVCRALAPEVEGRIVILDKQVCKLIRTIIFRRLSLSFSLV